MNNLHSRLFGAWEKLGNFFNYIKKSLRFRCIATIFAFTVFLIGVLSNTSQFTGVNLSMVLGRDLSQAVSEIPLVREFVRRPTQKATETVPTGAGSAVSVPKDDPSAGTPKASDAQPCAELAKSAADAVEKGLIFKAERIQKMSSDMQCSRYARP